MSMGGGGSSGTQTQKTEPWAGQMPYLTKGFSEAERLYDGGGPNPYPNATLAPADPAQYEALDWAEQRARAGNPLVGMAQGLAHDTMAGYYADAGNPLFEKMAGRVKAQVQGGIESPFVASGRSGSGLHGRALGEGLGDAIGGLAYQNHNDERNRMVDAMRAAPALAEADYADAARLGAVGDARRGLAQGYIDDDVARWDTEENADWNRLANYTRMIQGNYGSSATTTGAKGSGNPFAGALGGGLAGSGVASALLPAAMASGPVGWGVAAGGGLLGLLGSR